MDESMYFSVRKIFIIIFSVFYSIGIYATSYVITVNAYGDYGHVEYDGISIRDGSHEFIVEEGGTIKVTAIPDANCRVSKITTRQQGYVGMSYSYIDDSPVEHTGSLSSIKENGTIDVYFEEIPLEKPTYVITVNSHGDYGHVEYDGISIRDGSYEYIVEEGGTIKVTAIPDANCRVSKITTRKQGYVGMNYTFIDDSPVEHTGSLSSIKENGTIDVYFEEIPLEKPTYVITVNSYDDYGHVEYDGISIRDGSHEFIVEEGGTIKVTAIPDANCRVSKITTRKQGNIGISNTFADDGPVEHTGSLSSIKENGSIDVYFEKIIKNTVYSLSITASGYGSVYYSNESIRSKSSSFTLNEDESVTIVCSPDNGYQIKAVKVNGSVVTVSDGQYTINSINQNTTIEVEFEEKAQEINIAQYIKVWSSGGAIIQTNSLINSGSQLNWTFSNESTASVTLKSLQLIDGETGTEGNKMAVDNSVEAGISVSYSTKIGLLGIHVPVTCRFWYEYGGKEYYKDAVYTGKRNYTLTISASGAGAADYGGSPIRNQSRSFSVEESSSVTIAFTSDEGYRIKSVKVNNSAVNVSNGSYTISNISRNTTVDVEFEVIPPTTYTLSITASGNGSASYNSSTIRSKTDSFTLDEGASATITFSPDAGYRIKSVKVNNSAVAVSNNSYTISSISGNTTVDVEFEAMPPTTYVLFITASGNGSASYDSNTIRSKTSSFTLNESSSATITFTPDDGYRIKSVKVNNSIVSVSNNSYTISSISGNTTVEVEFEAIPANIYTLTIKVSGNGLISYNGTTVIRNNTNSFSVNAGASARITFSPDTGYRIKSVKVNDVSVDVSDNSYTISNISRNTTVDVEFEAISPTTYTLSITASGNGSASYNSSTIRSKTDSFTLDEGSSATITFSPDAGYRIKSVKVNNSAVAVSNNSYTVSSISGNTTVEVEFEAMPPTTYVLFITASGNGSASYDSNTIRSKTSSFALNEGTSATITFGPDDGYRIKSVKVNNSVVTVSNNSYTVSSISGNTTVEVEFEAIPKTTYTLTIKVSDNGSVSYNGQTFRNGTQRFAVEEGTEVVVNLTPDEGYQVAKAEINGLGITENVSAIRRVTISSMRDDKTIEVEFEAIPVTVYTLSITASGSGLASYNDNTIRSKTSSFTLNEGTSATITFSPDNGYRIKSVKVNNSTVPVSNNSYTISSISGNTTVDVEFEEIPVDNLSYNGVNYNVVSNAERTVKVAKGDYGLVLRVPASFTADRVTWNVVGIEDNALQNASELAAIVWEPEVAFTASVSNPNLLLYVKSAGYAPSTVKNVVANGVASSITLMDATSGNNFYCPQEFAAQRISYTHNYGMTSGIGEARGWETIALPFDVQKVTHSSKGEIQPFSKWQSGDNRRPFWLMELSGTGFVQADGIKANTPYIICMPNNSQYKDEFRLAGNVTFSAENVAVKASYDLVSSSYTERTLMPNFTEKTKGDGCYALNVINSLEANSGGMTEGSRFVLNSRKVHPFEAYMTSTSAARYIGIFDDATTGIHDLYECDLLFNETEEVFDLQGRKVMARPDGTITKGVYIKNGKKLIIK